MACTAVDLQTAFAAGATAAFAAAGAVPTGPQTAAIQAAAVAQYPLPGPALRVIVLQLADGTNVQVRVNSGKLERFNNQTQAWQQVLAAVSIDTLGPSALATLADLFARPTV